MRAPISSLIKEIPFGVMLNIVELRKLNIFNNFYAYAPRECFDVDNAIHDPVITGRIFKLTTSGNDVVEGSDVEFFIAKW